MRLAKAAASLGEAKLFEIGFGPERPFRVISAVEPSSCEVGVPL